MAVKAAVKAKDLPYRRRVGTRNGWQMPQGGIDKGESPADAALRELEEEIGTRRAEIVYESRAWHRYDLPAHLIGKAWQGRFRGQEQRWFLLRFTGTDGDIDIATDHPEFKEWRWASPAVLCDLIAPFKRKVYRQVVAEFRPQLDLLTRP